MKKNRLTIIANLVVLVSMLSFVSCKNEGGLAKEYMPDMYRSPAIEPYVDYADYGNPDAQSVREPVKGTIPRGFQPYAYENTFADYELAGQNLTNPLEATEEVLAEGKELYKMFCTHCHGDKGEGDGSLVKREKFPPVPSYTNQLKDLPAGKMFHTITYGKGLMGPHASQLTQEERWKLVHYIMVSLQGRDVKGNTEVVEVAEGEEVNEEAEAPAEVVEEESAE